MEYSWAIRTLVIIIIITIIMVAIFINSSHLYIYNCLLACAGGHTPQVWRVVKDSAVGRGLPNIWCVCMGRCALRKGNDGLRETGWMIQYPNNTYRCYSNLFIQKGVHIWFPTYFFFSFLFLLPLLWLLFQITMGTFFRLSVNLHFILVSQFVKQCNTLVPAS